MNPKDNSLQAQISAQISAENLQTENVGAQVADANANPNLMQAQISSGSTAEHPQTENVGAQMAQISAQVLSGGTAEHSQTENVGAQMTDNHANPNGVPEAALPSYGPPTAHQNPLIPAVGTIWTSRQALCNAKMHANVRSGISVGRNGTNAVVLSGGYEDDYSINNGETVYYTGAGGRDRPSGGFAEQTSDQTFAHPHNRALQASAIQYTCEAFLTFSVILAVIRRFLSSNKGHHEDRKQWVCNLPLQTCEEAKSSTIADWPGCLKPTSITNMVPFLQLSAFKFQTALL
ncbi:hypothetical protein FIBSPDRAFT_966222 [Athelia psychrophila]|uniref:YDG domain-containing protein n=1 Tax=Athelia psychrophila TaxID=1759441 RepID=A0A167X1A9_9AGAM|nr:hypothetical protein FIBSPDRAFT_966222 [Fibularhizoctonia sp. CBS 109695]